MLYTKVLADQIENEKKGIDYKYNEVDRFILEKLLSDINEYAGTDFHYLAELDAFAISGVGEIIAKYITEFSTQSIRGYLLDYMVVDSIKDCDKLVLQLYHQFKESDEYISKSGVPSPAHIYARYDNAFTKLKSKRIKNDLVKLAYNVRDVFYLPFTMRMLASWRLPEMKQLLMTYLDSSQITKENLRMDDKGIYYPDLEFIRRELKFTSLNGLKYYASKEIKDIIEQYIDNSDSDIRESTKKTLKVIGKKLIV